MAFTVPVNDEHHTELDFRSALGHQFITDKDRDAVLALVLEHLLNCYSAVELLDRQQADLLCDVVGDLLSHAESSCGRTAT